jgi:hypothetical protein
MFGRLAIDSQFPLIGSMALEDAFYITPTIDGEAKTAQLHPMTIIL